MTSERWNQMLPSERQDFCQKAFNTSIHYGTWTWEQLPISIKAELRLVSDQPINDDFLKVAKGCLGYFQYMKDNQSEFTPDEAWIAPLREAIRKAEAL